LALIGVIDYGSGNIGNLSRALTFLNREHALLKRPDKFPGKEPDALILPGVGAFPPAMDNLVSSGWRDRLRDWAKGQRPLLGICLGMQLMCEGSTEGEFTEGLGIFRGVVSRIAGALKLPHVGWNTIYGDGFRDDNFYYFVHSYALGVSADTAAFTSVDRAEFTAIADRERSVGFQFHPERSGRAGLALLEGYLTGMGV